MKKYLVKIDTNFGWFGSKRGNDYTNSLAMLEPSTFFVFRFEKKVRIWPIFLDKFLSLTEIDFS